jgi:tetratricopeptide (TPR) repeat protein
MKVRSFFALFLVGGALTATPAAAQSLDKAVSAYKRGDFESAAAQFYTVLRFGEEEGDKVEAQYGLAKSFTKLELPLAALKYYEDIVKVGSDHPSFGEAVEGLLDVGDVLKDDLKTPQILDAMYTDENRPALMKLNSQVVQRMHFVLGRYNFNRGNMGEARQFLKTVKAGNPSYAHAQYMLGLMRLGVGRPDNPKPKYEQAIQHFENARNAIPKDTKEPELLNLHDLATLGIARTFYEQAYELEDGDPKRTAGLKSSVSEYQRVPRFSEAWADSLFERAWAHTVANEYGRALGALHSLRAPYFSNEFYPEAKILQAIVYYYNCQWDRVNGVLEETKNTYEPMTEHLQALLQKDIALDEWYPLLHKSLDAGPTSLESGLLPGAVALAVSRDPKFAKMQHFLDEAEREKKLFQQSKVFQKSDMGQEMTDFAGETRAAYLAVIGKFLRAKVQDTVAQLGDITTRASLVALETRTAEVDWLEQGKETSGRVRKRLPRPFIPDDTFQFWWFRNEYWVDELGYYEFTIKTECFE